MSNLFLLVLGIALVPVRPLALAEGHADAGGVTVRIAPHTDEPIDLITPTGIIHGTLLLPAGTGPFPVALLIAGSGPTDRDGNITGLPGHNNSYWLLAEGLAQRGIATVRFDKRGVATSGPAAPPEAKMRFGGYIDDAVAWLKLLRADKRFSTVSVIGHSEGSLIGIGAARVGHADGMVSVAGAGRPAGVVLREQLRPQLTPALNLDNERILSGLEAGRTTDSVPPALAPYYRASTQPYLISWFRHDPAAEIAALHIPVLIVQGTTDIQVAVSDAQALHAAKPDAELLVIDGMNHALKSVPADQAKQVASYGDPSLPVVPELIDAVAKFLHKVVVTN